MVDNLNKRTVKWAILGTLVILAYMLGVFWWWSSLSSSDEIKTVHCPQLTAAEKRIVKASIRKHGNYTIAREGCTGRFIMYRNGETITLKEAM